MLKIKNQYDFWKTIKVSIPSGDSVEHMEFRLLFAYDVQASKAKASEIMNALPAKQEKMGLDFIKSVITDWDGVVDENGATIAYSKQALEQVLDIPWVAKEILSVWISAINGDPALGN